MVIFAEDNFKCIFLNETDKIPVRAGAKPLTNVDLLPEPMLTQFIVAYMRH